MRRRFLLVCAVAVLSLCACSTAPRLSKMTPMDPTVTGLQSTGKTIRIAPPQYQGQDPLTAFVEGSDIKPGPYYEALVATLTASKLFTKIDPEGEADYTLEPMITGQDLSGLLDATGSFFVYYTIRSASTGQVLWDKEILGKYTATIADAIVGANRAREAREGAVRDNLQQLVWALSEGALLDSDGDGVPDARDKEPNTPPGAEVDFEGVSRDDDGDGVPNGIDLDPHTAPGRMVDQYGRPIDADHDGVDDPKDDCPDTPAGYLVDERGCPHEISILEEKLIDVGQFEETRIYFETARATLQPESFPHLDMIGQVLSDLPELRFAVDGHCDERGTDDFNQTLSENRAAAVIDYLVENFPGLSRNQFTARGFGKTRPVAMGKDEASLAKNRRVEFVVLNREEARRQIETKRFLQRGEAVPDSLRRDPRSPR